MPSNTLKRRVRIPLALATVGIVALSSGCALGGSSTAEGGGQVVVATYAGPVADAMQEAYFDDFTADTGTEVVQVPADVARYVSMAQSGSSEWDTIDADGFANVDWVTKDLVQPYADEVPKADLVDDNVRDYVAGAYSQSFVLAYRASAFETAPKSWADFWDTTAFPGKRGWPSSYIGTVEAALLADGIAAEGLFPLDFDRGFAKLDEVRDDLTFYESYSALTQALQAGSVDMALLPSGRAVALSADDPDIATEWNQNIFYPYSGFSISVGAPNPEAMNKLGEYLNDPERQAKFAEMSSYGPTVEAAYDLIPEDVAPNLPGTEEHRAVAAEVDTQKLAAQTDEYIKRYSDWLAQ
jgi:putative spermidine/putrescine transport system substrate-binding protein